MPLTDTEKRQRRVLAKYGRNAAGKFIRAAAFRECDYTPEGALKEFDTDKDALAFEEERYKDGTGYHVKFWSKPKDTVPKKQLALEKAVRHAVEEDGNKTRVQMEQCDEGQQARHGETQQQLASMEERVSAQVALLAPKAALRGVVNRHGFVYASSGDYCENADGDIL